MTGGAARHGAPAWARRAAHAVVGFVMMAALVGQARPAQAQAYGWYGYESFGYGYMPTPIVVAPGPPLLSYENQYFDVSVRGVTRLCETHPELCQAPPLQSALLRLQRLRTAGLSMAWTGLATAVVGPIVSTSVNCARADTYCRPNEWVVLGTVLGGLAVGITGLALLPETHNVVSYINAINQQSPEHPVQLKLSVNHTPGLEGRTVRETTVVASKQF